MRAPVLALLGCTALSSVAYAVPQGGSVVALPSPAAIGAIAARGGDASAAVVTATGGATPRTLAALSADEINVGLVAAAALPAAGGTMTGPLALASSLSVSGTTRILPGGQSSGQNGMIVGAQPAGYVAALGLYANAGYGNNLLETYVGSTSEFSIGSNGNTTINGTLQVAGNGNIGGTLGIAAPGASDSSNLAVSSAWVRALGYAPLASPALTGTPTAPTQGAGDNSVNVATTAYADRELLVGSPATLGATTATTLGVSGTTRILPGGEANGVSGMIVGAQPSGYTAALGLYANTGYVNNLFESYIGTSLKFSIAYNGNTTVGGTFSAAGNSTVGGTLTTTGALAANGGLTATTITATGFLANSVGKGLTAAGTTLATALALTAQDNFVTSVASGAGVALPNAPVGAQIQVVNRGANALTIYPYSSTDVIEAQSGGASVSLATGSTAMFKRDAALHWYQVR